MVFFFGGFDTVATAMCFIIHLLAIHGDIQEKLISEIDDVLQQIDGKSPSYENIQSMEYLDMVLCECLRMHTPGFFLDRKCNKRIVIRDVDDNPVVLNPGDDIIIPVDAIHYDPQYFPNPTKFDPERFSKQNLHNIQPFTYSPFGIGQYFFLHIEIDKKFSFNLISGPRSCIANRFALMECKAVLFSLLSVFRIEKNEKTADPIALIPKNMNLRIQGGFNVRFRKRQ